MSPATLSYWRQGAAIPTRERTVRAVTELETILGLPITALTVHLPSDLQSRWDPVRAVAMRDQGAALMTAMGLDPVPRYHNEWLNDFVEVSADHTHQRETTRQLLRNREGLLERTAILLRQEFLEDPAPLVTTGAGCRLGRVVELDDQGLMAIEILLDHPAAAGELTFVEYTLDWTYPADITESGFTRVLPESIAYLVLDVMFEEAAPPAVEYVTTPLTYEGTNPPDAFRQPVAPGRYAQVAISDPSPGMHAIEWTFGKEASS